MRKIIVTLMASVLGCSTASAFWPEATDSAFEIGVGYRNDNLKWKTGGRLHGSSSYSSDYSSSDYSYSGFDDNGYNTPDRVRSELKWKNLNVWLIDGRGKYITCDNFYFRGNADYGWITSGKNRDRDFRGYGDDDSFEFCRSHSKVRGHVYDVRLAVGYLFKFCDDSFGLAPVIGYSWHGKHLRDHHLRQSYVNDETCEDSLEDVVIARRSNSYSSYSYDYSYDYSSSYSYSSSSNQAHSRYNARWAGPFIGFDFDYNFACEWALFGSYEFHWAHYHARAKWNLRTDLCGHFHQHVKNFYGNIFEIGVKWDFCDCWTLALRGEFQWWNGNKGRDSKRFFKGREGDVHLDCYAKIPLRHLRTYSAAAILDLGMAF
jgi:hypothetical protein